jgi:hypothetical protein
MFSGGELLMGFGFFGVGKGSREKLLCFMGFKFTGISLLNESN